MPTTLAPWLRGHVAPLILVGVASWQFYHVVEAGWNTWRGGGFGMYAGFHPSHTEVWVTVRGEPDPQRVLQGASEPEPYARILQGCLVRANRSCLRSALRRMPSNAGVTEIEIWRLSFDPSSALLRRELLTETAPEDMR
jgi:hypothetical protein